LVDLNLAWSVNVFGAAILTQICKKYGLKLIHFSSVTVFDGKKGNYSEKEIPFPLEKNFTLKPNTPQRQ